MTQGLTRIVAIRHGQTAWNVDTRIQGQLDIGLDDTGRWQAARLAQALDGERFDAVYSSDLQRALATAHALAAPAGLEVRTHRGLRERHFGVFEGLTYAEIKARYPQDALSWRQRDPAFGPPQGEALGAFGARVMAVINALAAAHRGQHIAMVAHGGVLDVLYRAALNLALDAPRTRQVGNASINRLLAGDAGFTLVGWGDCGHLADPPLDEAPAA